MASVPTRPVAIVTGAASGIGSELASQLVATGWNVACGDRNVTEGAKAASNLGPHASFFEVDVADYSSQAAMFQAVWGKWNRIDALCANAGVVDRGSLYILDERGSGEIPQAPDLRCTDIVYKGVVYGTKLATHFMRKNPTPGGTIVATASVVSLYPHEGYPEYCGAKAAVLQFMRAASPVLRKKDNISFNAVLPGIVPTAILPQEMIDAVSPGFLTPASTIVKAYLKFLQDPELFGQAIECSVDKLFFVPKPEYLNGEYSKRATTVWEPLFKSMHHEDSGLPDAIA